MKQECPTYLKTIVKSKELVATLSDTKLKNDFDNDCRQSNSSQFKSQDKGKKDARDGGQYTVPVGPKCFGCQGFGHMK